MAKMIFVQDYSGFDSAVEVTERNDPVYGPVTIFHDVVIAREIVHPFEVKGEMLMAYKSADELEQYWPWVEGRWAIAGRHPATPVIVTPDDISGRTVNVRFVKNLKDTKTGRPNIRGILTDLEVFNDRVTPDILKGMLDGSLPSLSIGYLHAQEMTPGKWNGEDYDFKQTNMFHDHTAFGIRKGRCPFPACGIGADSLLEAKCLNEECPNRQLKNMSTVVGHDPEETDESIRIPGPGGDCEVTATIVISEDQGISALYCGEGEDKKVRTYIFDKEKDWTMEKAQAWVDEHEEGAGADMLNRLIKLDLQVKAHDQEETSDAARAKAHYELTDELWDSLSAKAKTALIAALPEEPAVGADMSEEELKVKIEEVQKQLDDLYATVPEEETEERAAWEILYAELTAYTEALTEMIKAKALAPEAEGGVDEVARSKRLLKDPRLRRDPIKS